MNFGPSEFTFTMQRIMEFRYYTDVHDCTYITGFYPAPVTLESVIFLDPLFDLLNHLSIVAMIEAMLVQNRSARPSRSNDLAVAVRENPGVDFDMMRSVLFVLPKVLSVCFVLVLFDFVYRFVSPFIGTSLVTGTI